MGVLVFILSSILLTLASVNISICADTGRGCCRAGGVRSASSSVVVFHRCRGGLLGLCSPASGYCRAGGYAVAAAVSVCALRPRVPVLRWRHRCRGGFGCGLFCGSVANFPARKPKEGSGREFGFRADLKKRGRPNGRSHNKHYDAVGLGDPVDVWVDVICYNHRPYDDTRVLFCP